MGEAVRPAARGVEAEGDPEERDGVEEVALLHPVAVDAPGRCLEEEGEGDRERERSEGQLLAGARPAQREPEAEEPAGDEDDPGRVDEERRVGSQPPRQLGRHEVLVEDAAVEAERAPRADGEERHGRQDEGSEHDDLLAERGAQPPLAEPDDDRGGEEAEREDGELEPGEGGEAGESEERDLDPPAGLHERDHAGGDGAERERVGERLREDPGGIDQVGDEDREEGERERSPGRQPESPREQEDRHGGQRHGERTHGLDDAEGGLDVVGEPGGGGEDRL